VSDYDPAAFDAFEAAGWEGAAAGYGFFAATTSQAGDRLLDAAEAREGRRVLDVGTGLGTVAARAAERGADAVGIDIASAMVDRASRLHPGLTFRQGSATELPFPDGSFDAVVGNLVILHLGEPELAARESLRVLVPDGRAAFSTWDAPERSPIFAAIFTAVAEASVDPTGDVPAGPSFFRFADDDEFTRLLAQVGFAGVTIDVARVEYHFSGIDDLVTALFDGTVRVGGMLRAASGAQLDRIRASMEASLSSHRRDNAYSVPAPIKIVSGGKPS
jgi:ubiquinone/menaquinone biosynthesis C-methylase UbiE